jgi:hypothetical protein
MTTLESTTTTTIYNNGYLPGVDATWDRIVLGVQKWIPGYYPGCTLRVVKLPVDFMQRKEVLGECFVSATKSDNMVAVLEDMEKDHRFCAIDPNNTYHINYRRDNFEVVDEPDVSEEAIAIGDTVKIVDTGHTYNTYWSVFKEVGFFNTEENHGFKNDTIAYVWWVGKHDTWPNISMYALRTETGDECLIGLDGIEKVQCEDLVFSMRIDSPNVSYDDCNRTFTIKRRDLWKWVLNRTDLRQDFVFKVYNPTTQRSATFKHRGELMAQSIMFFNESYQVHLALQS